MKHLHLAITCVAICVLASSVEAEDEAKKRRGQGFDRAQILKEFDADGDGKLNDEERTKAKEAFARRRNGQGNRPGAGRPQGRPGPGGQGQGRPNLQQLLKEFDKDGDGKLSEQERAAAREFVQKRQAGNFGQRRIPEQVLKRFDKDGDGKLNEQEQAAARKAREEFMKRNGNASGRPNTQGRPDFKEILAKFDADGDGKLNDEEKAAAREAAAKMRRQRGNAGRPQPEAKEKPGRVNKKELLKRFDTDGDGKLSGDERAAAREAFQNRDKE